MRTISERSHGFRLPGGGVLAALGLLLACGAGCAEAEDRSGGPSPAEDNLAAGVLQLQEEEIGTRVTAEGTVVRLVLHRLSKAAVSGQAQVELRSLADDTVLATAQGPFAAREPLTPVELTLPFRPDDDASPASLAAFVIHYRVTWSELAIWGRRSLFASQPLTEVQLLGPTKLLGGGTAQLRLIARQPASGEPAAALPVSVAFRPAGEAAAETAPRELFSGTTDAQGNLVMPVDMPRELVGPGTLLVRVLAAERPLEISANVAVESPTRVLLTTDKPIYQPGQQIHLRVLALRRPSLEPDVGQPVVLEIFDGKGNKVEHTTVTTDEYGIASTIFRLAREVNMGSYKLTASQQGAITEKTVTVERYALPKFDIDLSLDREVYLAGSELQGTVEVRYFFGEPVRGAAIVVSGATLDAGTTLFAEVHGTADEQGLFGFRMQLPPYIVGLPLEQGGGLVQLALQVTDTAGQQRTVAKSVRVAPGPLEVVVVPESGELVPGLVNLLLVQTRDAAGRPVATHNVPIVDDVEGEAFETDAQGMAAFPVAVSGPALRLTLITTDDAGNRVESSPSFSAGAAVGAVLLRTDRALYQVGDVLRAEVQTLGVKDRVYLDLLRAGQPVLTKVLVPDAQGLATADLPLTAEHAGTLQLEAYTLALGASLRRDGKLVYVDRGVGLQVAVESDRPLYLPGEQAQLRFQVTDQDGVGKAAALGVQIVDEAVFGLLEFRPGLEKSYFEFEAELGEPRYQIGVPSLPVLAAAEDAAADPVRQEQARLLFAASDPAAGYPLAINTFQQAQQQVVGVVKAPLEALIEGYFTRLREAVQKGWFDERTLPAAIRSGYGTTFDPWGRPLVNRLDEEEQELTVICRGPDEILDTGDDVAVSTSLYQLYNHWWGPDPAEGDFDWAAGGGRNDEGVPMADAEGGEGEGDGESSGGSSAPRVRRDFPETLLVQPSLITDGTGAAVLDVPLADSITTWRLTAMANSRAGQLGSTDFAIRVFQDFFVDIDFPATLTRQDEFAAPIALYNYLDVPQTVELEVITEPWFTLLGPARQTVDLGPGEVRGVRLPIRVDVVGQHELTVFAHGSSLSDAVARAVEVVPDGHPVSQTWSGRLDGDVRRPVSLPLSAIPGSGKLLVKVYPGLFASVVEGMDGILRMPSGCFEQTSASTWPNVLVASYLRETGQGTPEIELRANEYINAGYQRLLTFEVAGGGFEWFGSPPAHVVLTAYGLLEFTDMARVRPVDEAMLARTRAWLLAQQKPDGSWEATRGLDETGNLTDPVTITAYVAFALAAAGERGQPLERARAYLEPRLNAMGSYTLALFANFLAAYQPGGALTGRLLDELATRVAETVANESQPGDLAYWETSEQTTTYGNGEPAWIETTALATHALLVASAHPDVTGRALDWLVTRKDGSGAWGSTAGTVWTVKCLLMALGGRDETADATVEVRLDGQPRGSFTITGENADVVRQVDLSTELVAGEEQLVEVVFRGQGNLQYGIVAAHHEPWEEAPPPEGPLSISVSYDRTQLAVDDTVTVTVRIANNDEAYADMVMVDLGIPPGFDLVHDDLRALQAAGVFSRYESTERQLLLYFTRIAPGPARTFQYRIVARDPIRAVAPASRIYSYYNPEVGAQSEPVDVEVEE